jgi:hypothetical protein
MNATIADTFEWCKTCWLADPEKVTNHGGDCCILKKKRGAGRLCDYWIRKKEETNDTQKFSKEW